MKRSIVSVTIGLGFNRARHHAATSSPGTVNRSALAALASIAALASACAAETGSFEEPERVAQSAQSAQAAQAITSCVTLQRGTRGDVEDAAISSDPNDPTRADLNKGASQSLAVGAATAANKIQSLVRWDLSQVPMPANITSATATTTTLLYGSGAITAHRVTAPWEEASVTYNSFGGAFSPAIEGTFPAREYIGLNPNGSINGPPQKSSADLTDLVQDWASGAAPNHGVLLQNTTALAVLASSETPTIAQRPALEVCYTCVAPVGWWKGNDNMLDSAGSNHGASGTQSGASPVAYGTGVNADAFAFAGSSYVQVPNAPSLQLTKAVTLDAWIFASSYGGRIIDKVLAGYANGYMIDTYTGRLRFVIAGAAVTSSHVLPTGTWVHVAATWDGSTANVYVNGALDGTAAVAGPTTNAQDLRIGADSAGNSRFNGLIDEAAVYDVALTPQQIEGLAVTGASTRCSCVSPVGWWKGDSDMLDSSGQNHGASGTQSGATPVAYGTGVNAGAFAFAGSSYVRVPNAPSLQLTKAVTLDAWIYPTAVGGRIIDKVQAGLGNGYMIDTYTGRLRFVVANATVYSSQVLPTGTWVHVAATWDGSTAKVYVNGVLSGSGAATGPTTNAQDLRIGADSAGNSRFKGLIDEAAVYDIALTPQQIASLAVPGAAGRCF